MGREDAAVEEEDGQFGYEDCWPVIHRGCIKPLYRCISSGLVSPDGNRNAHIYCLVDLWECQIPLVNTTVMSHHGRHQGAIDNKHGLLPD